MHINFKTLGSICLKTCSLSKDSPDEVAIAPKAHEMCRIIFDENMYDEITELGMKMPFDKGSEYGTATLWCNSEIAAME